MNKFKDGDKVYYPLQGTKIFTLAERADIYRPFVIYQDNLVLGLFDSVGCRLSDKFPSIYPATPENRKALEQLYGVEFGASPDEPITELPE